MRKLNKLELAWIGKEYYPKLEQRILVEDTAKSHHASFRIIGKTRSEGLLPDGKTESCPSYCRG
jgi:hypothetical protein